MMRPPSAFSPRLSAGMPNLRRIYFRIAMRERIGLQVHFLAVLLALLAQMAFAGDSTVTFQGDVLPIFQKNCSGCHFPTAEKLRGGLDLSTRPTALKGGNSGPSIVAGKPDESPLIKMIEWKIEPHMPPSGKFKQLAAADIATVKRWIAQGAHDGSATAKPEPVAAAPTPSARPSTSGSRPPSICALAYAATDKELLLAKGSLHTVSVDAVDRKTGALTPKFTLEGHAEYVRSVAFSPNGKILAAAGGLPGRSGEIKLWDTAGHKLVKTMSGHKDNILAVAFSPDGKRLASCSYDKTIIVWNVESGKPELTLTEHVDPVYTVAFSPDRKLLASGAGDRTVKLWDAASGKMLLTISDALDAVYALAFSPSGKELAGAGADKMIRVWDMGKQDGPIQQSAVTAGVLLRSAFAHEGAVLRLAYSPDGAILYSTAEDKRIKQWKADSLKEAQAFEPQSEWVTGFALSPDGTLLAAGRYDASLSVYASATGQRLFGENPRRRTGQSQGRARRQGNRRPQEDYQSKCGGGCHQGHGSPIHFDGGSGGRGAWRSRRIDCRREEPRRRRTRPIKPQAQCHDCRERGATGIRNGDRKGSTRNWGPTCSTMPAPTA